MIYRPYVYLLEHACTLIQARERGRLCENRGVDSERLAYRCLKGEYILGGRGGFRECPRPQSHICLKEGIFWCEGGVDSGRAR